MRTLPIVAMLLVTGCGFTDDGADWQGTVETLPNGATRVTNAGQGLWADDGGRQLEPELVLGTVDGPGETVFAQVAGLEVDAGGRLYVLDRQTSELKVFGPDGSHLRTVGGAGGGPGEYRNANGLRWLAPDDSLLVVDQRGMRYSVLTRDGEFARSVQRQLGFYGWTFRGGVHDGRVYEHGNMRGDDGEARPAFFATRIAPPAGQRRAAVGPEGATGAGLEGATAAGPEGAAASPLGSVDTIPLPEPSGPVFEAYAHFGERGGMSMQVPFASRPVFHLDDDGHLWHGHGSDFRLVRSTLPGDTLLEVVLLTEPAPVSQAEIDEFAGGEGARRFREMGGDLDLSRIPDHKPYFDDIMIDDEGRIWASVPAPPMVMRFDVFDAEGRYLGRLEAAGLARDRWVPPVVRDGRLHVVGRDELDVQRVFRFRIGEGA